MTDHFVDHLGTLVPTCTAQDARFTTAEERAFERVFVVGQWRGRLVPAEPTTFDGPTCDPAPVAPEQVRVPLPSGLGHAVLGEDPPMEHPSDGGRPRPSPFTAAEIAHRARLAGGGR